MVFVDNAAEDAVAAYVGGGGDARCGRRGRERWWVLLERSVGPVAAVVGAVGVQDGAGVSRPQDQDAVGALAPDGGRPSVRHRRSRVGPAAVS
jgi:hypothetical protein